MAGRDKSERKVQLDGTGLQLARELATATSAIKMWTDFREEVRERLVKILADADVATYAGRPVVKVTRTRPRRFNQKSFSADHPSLYESYREEAAEDEVRVTVTEVPEEADRCPPE